mmetsp:Transcript_28436/g.64477  ORF Transcript_28436/g.64477 Transcript_28436/m.64477 type:complete len:226 (+) Transcript_28436:929-1606(+)
MQTTSRTRLHLLPPRYRPLPSAALDLKCSSLLPTQPQKRRAAARFPLALFSTNSLTIHLQANNSQSKKCTRGPGFRLRANSLSLANGKGTAEKSARQDRAENRAGSSSVYTSKGVLYMDKERFEKGDAVNVFMEDGSTVISEDLVSLVLNPWAGCRSQGRSIPSIPWSCASRYRLFASSLNSLDHLHSKVRETASPRCISVTSRTRKHLFRSRQKLDSKTGGHVK